MVKSYLKYEQTQVFGTVASSLSNTVWVPNQDISNSTRTTSAGYAYVGANEEVLCWDVKKGELLSRWRDKDCKAEVTAIAQSQSDPDIFAVGHADGSIRLWDSRIAEVIIKFDGHRSAITILVFDAQGVRLASGSRDTDIVIWDLVGEAGLFKLRGHKNQITGLHFVQLPEEPTMGVEDVNGSSTHERQAEQGYLVSTSKDALIKLWDVESQYCIETHVTQSNGECWSLGVSPDNNGCITSGNDGQLTVWILDLDMLKDISRDLGRGAKTTVLSSRGTFNRNSRDHAIGVAFHPKANFVAIHGSEKAIEIWRIRTSSEIKKALARKRRRKQEKLAANGTKTNGDTIIEHDEDSTNPDSAPVIEVFVPYVIVRTGGKVRSIDWAVGKSSKSIQLLVSATSNQLELYNIPVHTKENKVDVEYDRTYAVDLPGHRTDIRAIALSSDHRMLATASSGSLKIWNVRTQTCLRTLDCGYALCCSFLPGDRIVLVGNKSGELELFDISSSSLIETIQAHEGPIWTMKVYPDGKSVATGSADKSAKFWNFQVIQEEIPGTNRTSARLKLVQYRALKVNDDILSLCISPDSRLIAVSTLDNTVKVFFNDSLKLYLTLYGHKLPVLNISIASDSKLIATCSADKNVRLWGLDFGDCHKSLFAHDESIMCVAFAPEPASREDSHLFFSAAKDGVLKHWDGDKFQQIQKLSGHHGEIWALCVSQNGDFVVTASHDKSIRVWTRTDEPLFLEEEREREQEELYDATLAGNLEKDQNDEYAAMDTTNAETGQVVPASKQTVATLTSSEKITEALELCTEDLAVVQEHERQVAAAPPGAVLAPPTRHPLLAFRNVTAEQHLLGVFQAIPSASLQDALLLLSFSQLPQLFVFLRLWLEKDMNVSLTCRVLFFLLEVHQKGLVSSRELKGPLEEIKIVLRRRLQNWKDVMGFNLAGIKILGRRVEEGSVRRIEDIDEAGDAEGKAKGKKRAFVNVA